MATGLTLRGTKGSALTHDEQDQNFRISKGYDTVAEMVAASDTFTAGTIITAGGYRYQAVASGGDLQNAGSQHLDVVWGGERIPAQAFNITTASSASATVTGLTAWANCGLPLRLTTGDWTINSEIQVNADLDLECDIGARVVGSTSGTFNQAIFRGDGTQTALPDLAGDVSEGDMEIEFASAHGLSAGDYFAIHDPTNSSFQQTKVDYRAGEACKVISVPSSTEVVVSRPLYGSYAAATVDCYQWDMRRVRVNGGDFVAPGDPLHYTQAFKVDLGVIELTNVRAYGSGGSNFFLARCVDGHLVNCTSEIYARNSTTNSEYALTFHSSQHMRVTGGSFFSQRHAVTSSATVISAGGIVNRDILVYGAHLKSIYNYAADFHGNSEFCGYDGCSISGGVNLRGNGGYVKSSKIWGSVYQQGLGINALVNSDELHGADLTIADNEMYSLANYSARAAIAVYGSEALNSNMQKGGTIRISGNKIEAPNTVRMINIRNQGSTQNIRIVIEGNDFGESTQTNGNFIQINKLSGDDFTAVYIRDNIDPTGNAPNITAATSIITGEESGYVDLTISSGNSRVSSGGITFAQAFPSQPNIIVAIDGEPESNGSGSVGLVVGAHTQSATGFNIRLATADGSNVAGDTTRRISWRAKVG